MTRDARGREVFSIAPALLGGGATYRTLAPVQDEVDAQQEQDDQPSDSAPPASGRRHPDRAR